jgi:hypothetical protein
LSANPVQVYTQTWTGVFAAALGRTDEGRRVTPRALPTYHRALATCVFTALSALTCAGLLSAAALVPAPPTVLPVVIAVCVFYPMLAAFRSSSSVAVLRRHWPRRRLDERALAKLRRELERLPEVGHPLDR